MKKAINFNLALKPLFWVYAVISSAFKHDCWMNKKLVSASYFKDGDSGVIFSTGKEYCCEKCGKRWSE
jgi:hypothetical protein